MIVLHRSVLPTFWTSSFVGSSTIDEAGEEAESLVDSQPAVKSVDFVEGVEGNEDIVSLVGGGASLTEA